MPQIVFAQPSSRLTAEGKASGFTIGDESMTALVGRPGSDAPSEIAAGIVRDSRSRLPCGFQVSDYPDFAISGSPQGGARTPLPVTVDLGFFADQMSARMSVWEALDLGPPVEASFASYASPRCSEAGCLLDRNLEADTILRFSDIFESESSRGEAAVAAVVSEPAFDMVRSPDKTFWGRFLLLGYRRFLVGNKLIRVSGANRPPADTRGVAASTFGPGRIEPAALEAAVREARGLGSPFISLVCASRTGKILHTERLGPDYSCPKCGSFFFRPRGPVARVQLQNGSSAAAPSRTAQFFLNGQTLEELQRERLSGLLEFALALPRDGNAALIEECLILCREAGLGALRANLAVHQLSSGERLRLGAAVVASLKPAEVLIVVDRPSAVLYGEDLLALLRTLKKSAVRHNSILIVDSDPLVLKACDAVVRCDDAPLPPPLPEAAVVRKPKDDARRGPAVVVRTPSGSRLELPLKKTVALLGRSGSGKTRLMRVLAGKEAVPGLKIDGLPRAPKPRLNECFAAAPPDTVGPLVVSKLGVSGLVAAAFSADPAARRLGLSADDFDVEKAKGVCPVCAGTGEVSLQLEHVGSVRERCPACLGRRFREPVLLVRLRGSLSIAELYEQPIGEIVPMLTETLRPRFAGVMRLGLSGLSLGQLMSSIPKSTLGRLEAAALCAVPDAALGFVLLDQPLAYSSETAVAECIHEFDRYCERGGSLLFSTHEPRAASGADTVVEMPNNFF